MNLPNRLSLFRILLIPVIVFIWIFPYASLGIEVPVFYIGAVSLSLKNIVCVVLFCIASITDFLDGYIARSRKMVTSFGKFIDPIADKCLTTTIFLLLMADNLIPSIPVIIMIWRDIIVDGIRMISAGKNVVMAAGFLGKLKTVSQMICLILLLINNLPFQLWGLPVADLMLWFSACMSVCSGYVYYKNAESVIWESK